MKTDLYREHQQPEPPANWPAVSDLDAMGVSGRDFEAAMLIAVCWAGLGICSALAILGWL